MPDSDTYPERLIPIGVAAQMLGVSVGTVRRWEASGRISSVRTPTGHRRFRPADVSGLLTNRAAS